MRRVRARALPLETPRPECRSPRRPPSTSPASTPRAQTPHLIYSCTNLPIHSRCACASPHHRRVEEHQSRRRLPAHPQRQTTHRVLRARSPRRARPRRRRQCQHRGPRPRGAARASCARHRRATMRNNPNQITSSHRSIARARRRCGRSSSPSSRRARASHRHRHRRRRPFRRRHRRYP